MEEITGKYQLTSTSNFEEYLRALGISSIMRTLAATARPVTEITVNGEDWSIKTSTACQNSEIKFRLGQEFEDETANGVRCRAIITKEGNTLIHKQMYEGQEQRLTREFGDDQMILKLTFNDVTATRIYTKLNTDVVQVPVAFGENIAQGAKFFLKNIGGAAGALSDFTGYIGKGAAALTVDEEFKESRREMLARRPHDATDALRRSSCLLCKGIVEGVSGVVVQPLTGIQREGLPGLFTGAVKGVMGVMTKPALGALDFAGGLLTTAKTATSISEEVVG